MTIHLTYPRFQPAKLWLHRTVWQEWWWNIQGWHSADEMETFWWKRKSQRNMICDHDWMTFQLLSWRLLRANARQVQFQICWLTWDHLKHFSKSWASKIILWTPYTTQTMTIAWCSEKLTSLKQHSISIVVRSSQEIQLRTHGTLLMSAPALLWWNWLTAYHDTSQWPEKTLMCLMWPILSGIQEGRRAAHFQTALLTCWCTLWKIVAYLLANNPFILWTNKKTR